MLGNAIALGFTRGGGAPLILGDGNTVAWFDYLQMITKDGSDFVSVWGDASTNSNDLLQPTGTNQPLWSSDGVLFDGVDNFMDTLSFTLNQPEFIYAVLKQVTWSADGRIFDGDTIDSGVLYQNPGTPQLTLYAGSNAAINGNLALDTFGVIRVLINGASSSVQINETTKTTGDAGSRDMGGFILGSKSGGALNHGNIQVKELIIRKIADTAPNEQIIYDYLAAKYSIP